MILLNLTNLNLSIKKISVLIFFIGQFIPSASTQSNIDSLIAVFNSAVEPLDKYEAQSDIAYYYYKKESYDTALTKYKLAAQMVPKNDFENKGKAVSRIARVYKKIEDLGNSIKYYKISKDLFLLNNCDPILIADVYKDIGRAFYGLSKYDSAMVYYMDSKKVYEKNNIINEDYGYLLHYIGSVFKRQDNMEKACEYYQMEMEYGTTYNFPGIYADGFYLSASCTGDERDRVNHHLEALRLYQEMEDESMVSLMCGNLALAYEDIGMLDSAYHYQMISLEYRRHDGGKSHLSSLLSNIGGLLIKMGRYNEAKEYLKEAESLAFQSDLKKNLRLREVYKGMYQVNKATGNYKSAIEFLELMYAYRDSSVDAEHQDAIHEMELSYETEKKEAEILMLENDRNLKEKEKLLAEENAAQQTRAKNLYLWGGLVFFLLGIFTFIKLRESQNQKKLILQQKKEMQFQKELVEEKNKDIMDSMVYASTIQRAIITSEEYISEMFNDFFILYKPRDIVSGDFYWAYETPDGKKLIAVGDCTGHGVPGAMMSMLGTAFLNEVVIEGRIREPHLVLEKMRVLIKKAMKNKGARDGMDMSFCCVDKKKMTFCGANLPIYIVRNEELIEIKGNKQPIGFHAAGEHPFQTKEFDLENNDHLYLFSDGYADQFGGSKGKKYKYKTLRDKLVEICTLNLQEQRNIINTEFETWKGDLEQLDDVCVIGIKV